MLQKRKSGVDDAGNAEGAFVIARRKRGRPMQRRVIFQKAGDAGAECGCELCRDQAAPEAREEFVSDDFPHLAEHPGGRRDSEAEAICCCAFPSAH